MLSCCVLGKASVILSLSHQHTSEMLYCSPHVCCSHASCDMHAASSKIRYDAVCLSSAGHSPPWKAS